MSKTKHVFIVIDRLEYYITKEIEKSLFGTGDKCFTALYMRLTECIDARKEIGYEPVPKNVEQLLSDYGYDELFIKEFISKVKNHSIQECPGH
jgi:hypothetical protein